MEKEIKKEKGNKEPIDKGSVVFRGVSGKQITADVKVVKIRKKETPPKTTESPKNNTEAKAVVSPDVKKPVSSLEETARRFKEQAANKKAAAEKKEHKPVDRRPVHARKKDEPVQSQKHRKPPVKKEEESEVIVRPKPQRHTFGPKDDTKKQGYKDKKDGTRTNVVAKDVSRTLKQQAAQFNKGQAGDEAVLDTIQKARTRNHRYPSKFGPRQNRGRKEVKEIPKVVLTHVSLPSIITVKELAEAIKKTSAEVIKRLINFGVMATLNQEVDYDTASIICGEFGITTDLLVEVTEEDILFDDSEDKDENLEPRPPVVVVMGHVDHGKTSLLDSIRNESVVTGEAGGITQHIGAYMVNLKGRKITFLDTPGHEAFTTMRARGAKATDIAILVVAADDGVMPQTIEAINHAKVAETQIIVAINKIDKPGANVDRVKQELSSYELVPEEWGGTTIMVPVSAKTGEGIEELLEMVLLTADVMELKTDPNRQAKGVVIEAKLDKQKGTVATLLVQRGTLKAGDTLVTGQIVGNVRAMTDYMGKKQKEAGPSVPVEIIGLPEVPEAGDIFYAVSDEKVARQLAEKRRIKKREDQIGRSARMSLDNLFSQMSAGEIKNLNVIVKADVQGSVEAVRQSLEKLTNEEVRVKVIHGGVGAITETDLRLAEVANAIVIGFNVRPAHKETALAEELGIDLRLYRVIYDAIADVESAMKGLLSPTFKEQILGTVEIRQVFKSSSVGTIGGGYVTKGKIVRSSEIRLIRDGIVILEGKLASLKRFKDDVKEVAQGYECGISVENYNDIKVGDEIEAFVMQEVKQD